MGRNSVFDDNQMLTVEALAPFGFKKLGTLAQEARQRLDNQARTYGATYRPGRQALMEFCLKRDLEIIGRTMAALNAKATAIKTPPKTLGLP